MLSAQRFSIAPMLDWTDRYFRFLARSLSPSTWLYTEMVPLGAVIHGDADYHLSYSPVEHPLTLQLGGSDPVGLGKAARIAASYAYDEIDLNVGCPSDRVAAGGFGISLFREPQRVADCVAEMTRSNLPVTVKTRLGVDELDQFEDLCVFVDRLVQAGLSGLTIHARMAYTRYSPRENRSIPPLDYARVYRLKREFPALRISINGHVESVEQVRAHLEQVDGVMVGRWIYTRPMDLLEVEKQIFGNEQVVSIADVVSDYLDYIEPEWGRVSPSVLMRPLQGMFRGQAGSRAWRIGVSSLFTARDPALSFALIRAQLVALSANLVC